MGFSVLLPRRCALASHRPPRRNNRAIGSWDENPCARKGQNQSTAWNALEKRISEAMNETSAVDPLTPRRCQHPLVSLLEL